MMSTSPPQPQEPLVKRAEIPGRGRALIATRTIKAGEIILTDSPLLLYPTSISSSSSFCSNCFRSLSPSSSIPCPSSCSSLFCSPLCLSSHSPHLCQSLRILLPSLPSDPDLLSQSLFLISAYSLSLSSPSHFSLLLSLFSGAFPSAVEAPSPLLPPLFPPDLTAALLARDHLNSFGLMEPFQGAADRKVRAYGIYPMASFFNHDCLPNACRFDYLDSPNRGAKNTDVVVRAIHEIPEGREVCLSYFPVNWRYKERQKRLLEDYGFRCECDRCLVERNWKEDDDENEEDMGEGSDEEMDEEMDEGEDDFPHAYFFVRFVCDRENCGGTMAPLPPSPEGTLSDVLECNVCGRLRREEDVDGDGDMVDNE